MIFAGLTLFSFVHKIGNDVSTSWAAKACDCLPWLAVSVIKETWFTRLFWDATVDHIDKPGEKKNNLYCLRKHSYEDYKITVDS